MNNQNRSILGVKHEQASEMHLIDNEAIFQFDLIYCLHVRERFPIVALHLNIPVHICNCVLFFECIGTCL